MPSFEYTDPRLDPNGPYGPINPFSKPASPFLDVLGKMVRAERAGDWGLGVLTEGVEEGRKKDLQSMYGRGRNSRDGIPQTVGRSNPVAKMLSAVGLIENSRPLDSDERMVFEIGRAAQEKENFERSMAERGMDLGEYSARQGVRQGDVRLDQGWRGLEQEAKQIGNQFSIARGQLGLGYDQLGLGYDQLRSDNAYKSGMLGVYQDNSINTGITNAAQLEAIKQQNPLLALRINYLSNQSRGLAKQNEGITSLLADNTLSSETKVLLKNIQQQLLEQNRLINTEASRVLGLDQNLFNSNPAGNAAFDPLTGDRNNAVPHLEYPSQPYRAPTGGLGIDLFGGRR